MSTGQPHTTSVNILVTKSLEIDEPHWCVGHVGESGQFLLDITHNGHKVSAHFDSENGSADYLSAWITQSPYSEVAAEPLPLVAVEVDSEVMALSPEEVRAFTARTRAHLEVLERLADGCERLREVAGGA